MAFILVWILTCSKGSIKLSGMSDVGYRIKVKIFVKRHLCFKRASSIFQVASGYL